MAYEDSSSMSRSKLQIQYPLSLTLSEIITSAEEDHALPALETTFMKPFIHITHPCVPDNIDLNKIEQGVSNPIFYIKDHSKNDIDVLYMSSERKCIRSSSWCENQGTSSDPYQNTTNRLYSLSAPALQSHPLKPSSFPANPPLSPFFDFHRLSVSSTASSSDSISLLDTEGSVAIYDRIRRLVEAFSERAMRVKQRIMQPPTPSSTDSSPQPETLIHRYSSLISLESKLELTEEDIQDGEKTHCKWCWNSINRQMDKLKSYQIDPQSKLYIGWLFIVTVCFTYNACVIFLRASFPYQTPQNLPVWFACDYFSDFIYLVDILTVHTRLVFIKDGFYITNPKEISRHYFTSITFALDVSSLMPLDVLYSVFGVYSLLRLPRLLKFHSFRKFFDRCDNIASTPYIIRIVRTLLYMVYLIHLNACAYYAYSDYEGIGDPTNQWVYDGKGNAYIHCFLFATKTATSIGKNPSPQNEGEFVFMTVSWLMGVFVFAILIGQIRDILSIASQSKRDYMKVTDRTLTYMQRLNLPSSLRSRVRLWFAYNWDQHKSLAEGLVLSHLPQKMHTDIAMFVHFDTLCKVTLFQDMEHSLLRDLVLKLKSVLYLPGDYICRKGEVGTEMYIVNSGCVEVVGGENNNTVVASLYEGSIFGEVSLLALAGGNRRTADVRSKGFSRLYVLTKTDLHEVVKHYPEAQEKLRRKAKLLMKKTQAKRLESPIVKPTVVIDERPETPQLVRTVIQVLPAGSKTAEFLRQKPK